MSKPLGMNKKEKSSISIASKLLLSFAGLLSVALGIIGIGVPILPTTPFFLLAAYLFLKSSPRLYHWLLNHKIFGNYISNYIHHKAIGKGVKIFTLLLLWGTILLSIYLVRDKLWLQILLLIIAMGVSIHILKLKTMPKKKRESIHLQQSQKKTHNDTGDDEHAA